MLPARDAQRPAPGWLSACAPWAPLRCVLLGGRCYAGSSGLGQGEAGLVQSERSCSAVCQHTLAQEQLPGELGLATAGGGGCLQWLCGITWQVPVWEQASSCPAGASLSPHPVPTGGALPGQLREGGDRKELLSFIVLSSTGSDNNSFLPHASGLAVGPVGQGCSHRATDQCGEGMVIWDWRWGSSDPWAVLAAEALWGCG